MSRITLNLFIARNRNHVNQATIGDAEYFSRHQTDQSPRCVWIGCADSRVPVENLVQANPGEIFVLRNVANQILEKDDNIMSGIQYALMSLNIDTIIICGHTGCGGVNFASAMPEKAAQDKPETPLQRQLRPLSYQLMESNKLNPGWNAFTQEHYNRIIAEENVHLQIKNLKSTTVFKEAEKQKNIMVYGCILDISTGILDVISGPVNNEGF